MWVRRSHVLAPLAALTSKTTEWKWEPQHQKAFAMAKRVIAKETLLAHPDFNKPFQIHTDASHCQSGAVASQDGKPIAFHSRKLNPAQTRHTAAERELLSTVETLKEHRNMLLGQQIEVFTDHENPVCKHFNAERVMRWPLLLEEFGPELTHVKGMNNVVAAALSRLDTAEEEFSAEAFANELANEEEDFPMGCPLSCKEPAFRQAKDRALQNKFRTQPELHVKKPCVFSDSTHELITENDEICVPESLQQKCAKWHHSTSMHPGEQRLELTTAQHHTWIGLRSTCVCACKRCENCAVSKKRDQKMGLHPSELTPEMIPWHTLFVDLVGPCKFGNPEKPKTHTELHCVTMADPATGFFETVETSQKTADVTANWLELHWLTRHPQPAEMTVDKGKEFAREVSATLKNECGVNVKKKNQLQSASELHD